MLNFLKPFSKLSGKGSYKKWMYEVNLFEDGKELVQDESNIAGNSHYLSSLKPNTTYSVKLRAYSIGGKGPWSSEFTGSTLDNSKIKWINFNFQKMKEKKN